ncbi:BRD4-interacting chromatin-remodeling complex-associated protein-like isoform X2 [Oryzias latipes]|uniref:BICRA like chromatin remodeling complex associated protein n=2 Tax=Oryzias latipes TaxID=8090 RepID=A0A3B3IF04_ORYLA|nr:BRD4-interacting chromatin-remodeling complex-associated protein-like isoform X2 [Oryzias latipes]XP_023805215.1 BRD4-interacting chromatin-remodeling complex-associated protein-like isoform X2 [Oryzias latipes]XP_023805217.1 BRD4-interacting chromatin-remodeling complex-associated protein-like isoform X2 [Oryzias latipes]XP_023805218.1 BRD4-interacting chromatin-remodeling complex-associated protein-like isoform X2 [Oryzias latipes]
MDDDDDRRLLDILGDVDALNDYLHGDNSKTIEEDDVTNAAYGSDGSFFGNDTAGSKDGSSSMDDFGEDSGEAGLQLSGNLSFIENELETGNSLDGVDLEGEDQPFDILQKSLLEADITEQTLAQEALLDSQPAPTLVQAPISFPSQLVSGNYGGGVGVVTTGTAAFPAGQVLQGMSSLPNGSAQHIQVLGSFGTGGGVMTLNSMERTPQIVLRPGVPGASTGTVTGGQVFAPTQGQANQVGLPVKNIPLQNIIIQRGPGGTQTVVRPIQPKPTQASAQTVYSLGLQPAPTSVANVNTNSAAGVQYATNGPIVVQQQMEQQQVAAQTNLTPGQFLVPSSLPLPQSSSIQNGPVDPNNQNTVQIVSAHNFSAPGAPLILNKAVVSASPIGGTVTQTWSGVSCASTTPVQTSCTPGRLTLIGPATAGIAGHGQTASCAVQRLLVTQTPNSSSLSPLPGNTTQEQDYRQNFSSTLSKQTQLSNIHGTQNSEIYAQKRTVPPSTRGEILLQQLRKDHIGVQNPERRKFTSIDDALLRLLSYHVLQGAPPSQDEFTQVDEEFEAVASQVLKRTQAMVNKYRRLLIVEAENSSPSSEIVMIDRTFNQEERGNLSQDKRMVLVDPDSFLEEFCCGTKSKLFKDPSPSTPATSCNWDQSERGSVEPSYRTDSQSGFGDPGGGGDGGSGSSPRLHSPSESRRMLDLKRSQQDVGSSGSASNCLITANSHHHGKVSHLTPAGGQTHYQLPQKLSPHPAQPQYSPPLASPPLASPPLASPPHPETDSALEAAVNSILEC